MRPSDRAADLARPDRLASDAIEPDDLQDGAQQD
jgi:hypothetical protein